MRGLLILLCLGFTHCAAHALYHEASVTVKVVDIDGVPIEGAQVGIGFEKAKPGGWGTQGIPVLGTTDQDGLFTGTATVAAYVGFNARKEGYYGSYGDPFSYESWDPSTNRWQPWNPTKTVVLRRVENPVPMYAKHVYWETLPALDTPVGYDLEVGDWVSPHGKGTVSDVLFTVHKHVVSQMNFDSSLELTFSRPGDGIQEVLWPKDYGSSFRLPRMAPEAGYLDRLFFRMRWLPGQRLERDFREDRSYFFRVRTVLDEQGNVVSAVYGKITTDIGFSVRKKETAAVEFTYCLNPDGTRNMEFDPKRNLLRGLDRLEEVRAP